MAGFSDYLDQQYSHTPPTTQAPEATLWDFGTAVGHGLVKGGASILDQFITPTIEGLGAYPQNENESGARDIAERYFPTSKKAGPAAVEGATEGAVANAPMGVEGAIRGTIGGGVTGYRNAVSPNTPIPNSMVGAATSGLAPITTTGRMLKAGLQGAGKMAEDNPILQAQRDLGITQRNAAGIGQGTSYPNTITALRDSLFSDSIRTREQQGRQEVENAFNDLTGPVRTRSEAGDQARSELVDWKDNTRTGLSARENQINNYIDPKTTMIDMAPAIQKLQSEFAPPAGAPHIRDPGADDLLNRIRDSVEDYAGQQQYGATWNAPKGFKAMGYKPTDLKIPLEAVNYIRQDISDDFHAAIAGMPAKASTTNNKIAYGTLADAQKSAYAGTGFAPLKDELNQDWQHYFNSLEQVQHLLPMPSGSKAQQLGTGDVYSDIVNKTPKDADKINQVLSLVPPDVRENIAGVKMRELATGANGQFNPKTFADNWENFKKISPEAKNALFGSSSTDYDKLAIVAREQARSEAALNNSKTGVVTTAFKAFTLFGAVSGAALIGNDYLRNGQESNWWSRGSEAGGAGLVGATVGAAMAARLFSNPGFVRILATNPPLASLPATLKVFASANPQLRTDTQAFSNFVQAKQQQDQQYQNSNFGKAERGELFPGGALKRAGGGEVTWPDQSGNTGYDEGGLVSGLKKPESKLFDKEQPHPEQIDPNQLGNTKNFKTPDKVPDYFIDEDKSIQNGTQEKNYMNGGYTVGPNAGGPGAQQMPNNQYAEGGAVGDDYNTKLSPDEEKQFQIWKAQNAPKDSGADYDLRGAYKAQLEKSDNGHWEDTFKKPNHPTFSEESQYSKQHPELPAGHWNNDDFIPPALYNEGGISQRNFALGGLTDTKNPAAYPPGYAQGGSVLQHFIGGGSVYSTENATPFAQGGEIIPFKNHDPTSDSNGMPPSILGMFFGRESIPWSLSSKNSTIDDSWPPVYPIGRRGSAANEYAQGGISHNTNDARPFYNPQLPGVTGGGWAGGGPIPPHMPQGMEDPSIIAPAPREKDYPQDDEFGNIPEHGSALSILDSFMKDGNLHLWGGGGVPNEKLTSGTEIGT